MQVTILIPQNLLAINGIVDGDGFMKGVINEVHDQLSGIEVEAKISDLNEVRVICPSNMSDRQRFFDAVHYMVDLYKTKAVSPVIIKMPNMTYCFTKDDDNVIASLGHQGGVWLFTAQCPFEYDTLYMLANIHENGYSSGIVRGVRSQQDKLRELVGLGGE